MVRTRIRQRGVSLVELMIVVAIIGLLLSLIIPAISKVRALSRRAANQNNIRQIMLAVNNYATNHDGSYAPAGPQFAFYSYGNCKKWDKTNPNAWVGTDCSSEIEKIVRTPTEQVISNKNNRQDWIDGGLFFQLLPYLGFDNVWDASYDKMGVFRRSKTWDDGLSGCPCTKFQDCGDSEWCDPCLERPACRTPGWVTQVDIATWFDRDYGRMAGRVSSRIKTYVGVGDPVELDLQYVAAVSYPLIHTPFMQGNLESISPAYSPFIAESYASCGSNPRNGYNSWSAASQYVDMDKDPIPASGGEWPVSSIGSGRSFTTRYWTGITGDGTAGSQADMSSLRGNARLTWVNDNITQKIPGAFASATDPTTGYVWYAVKPPTNLTGRYSTIRSQNMLQVSPTLISPDQQAAFDCKGAQSGALECHLGEWYYNFSFSAKGRGPFFADDPRTCQTGWYGNSSGNGTFYGGQDGYMHSLVPGSINIGMLDGSVKTFTVDTDPAVWAAFANGRSPTTDW